MASEGDPWKRARVGGSQRSGPAAERFIIKERHRYELTQREVNFPRPDLEKFEAASDAEGLPLFR